MDTYFVKLQGKANIPSPMEVGKNYRITCEGTVTQKKDDDNFDGTMNVTFKFEPVTIEIKDELGKSVRAKDPRSNSQKIRARLFGCYMREGYVEDFNDVYDVITDEIMSMAPNLVREAHNRLNR